MKIRAGRKNDVKAIKKYLIESWVAHTLNTPKLFNKKLIESSTLEEYFKPCFDGSNKSFLFIAEEKGQIAGICKVDIQKLPKYFNEKSALYIDDIYVDKKYRGRNVAKTLLREMENFARKNNIKLLKARIYEFNSAGQKTFKSVAFEPIYSEYFKKIK